MSMNYEFINSGDIFSNLLQLICLGYQESVELNVLEGAVWDILKGSNSFFNSDYDRWCLPTMTQPLLG